MLEKRSDAHGHKIRRAFRISIITYPVATTFEIDARWYEFQLSAAFLIPLLFSDGALSKRQSATELRLYKSTVLLSRDS